LFHASVENLLEILATQDVGFNSILIVGHNPGLTDLANFLVPGLTDNIPTCGFVSVVVDREVRREPRWCRRRAGVRGGRESAPFGVAPRSL
jgi:phosphohistidine phosphatase SixA